jgi:hypothetical protein
MTDESHWQGESVMMAQIQLTWLENNWFALATFAAGVIGTFVVYRWQKKERVPYYARRNVLLIKNTIAPIEGVEVHYRGHSKNIDNLSVAVIAIWNAGRETLDKAHFTTAKPLRVVACDSVTILGVSIIQCNTDTAQPRCDYHKTKNSADVTFDYLDKNEGFVLQVLHTGINKEDIRIEGAFKGCGDIARYETEARASSIARKILGSRNMKRRMKKALAVITILSSLMVIAFSSPLKYDGFAQRLGLRKGLCRDRIPSNPNAHRCKTNS